MVRYRNNRLFIENVSADQIATSAGTPVYVYSRRSLLSNFRAYKKAFRDIPNLMCYALKANSNLTLLKLLAQEGSGADIVSGGELHKALMAGFPPERIVFAGVGKTPAELEEAIRTRIHSIHVESDQELYLIQEIASKLRICVSISFRMNPDIQTRTHPYISTALRKHKFGIPFGRGLEIYQQASKLPDVHIDGMHIHLGSQITDVKPFQEAMLKALQLMDQLQRHKINLKHIDIGGGLAISVDDRRSTFGPDRLASVLIPLLKGRKLKLILEPGRSIVGSAGILLTRVLYTKENHGRHFSVVDAGMNDFIRPALYNAFHELIPSRKSKRAKMSQDVVGPVCESGDFFAKDRLLQACKPGDLLVITNAGAYGFAMSSNYNSRLRAPEVLVDRDRFFVIRKRESYRDLIQLEV